MTIDIDDFISRSRDAQTPPEPEPLPRETEDFLRWLDGWWPHVCPDQGESLEAIHRYAGARALIDMLLFRMFGPDKTKWKQR